MIPYDWLTEKLEDKTFEAVMEHHFSPDKIKIGVPDLWCKFIEKIVDTDELWYFRSPDSSWKSFSGRAGYAIVRNGKIIKIEITRLN